MPVRFTIAIPTHDRRETVLLALASALRQTRPPAEVVVLCDACTDGTAEAVRALGDPRVRVVELPKGLRYAYEHRNMPLRDPEADVVLWLADDDLLLPDHLEHVGAAWDADPGLAMVTAPAAIVHEDDRLEWLGRDWGHEAVRRALAERENHCPMAAVSVRAAAAREAGGWIGSTEREGDRRLWARILAPGDARVRMIGEPTVLHFRATTRRQTWPERVAQNTRWLARLQDPEQVAAIRAQMHAAHAERDARDYEWLLSLEQQLHQARLALAAEGEERDRLTGRLQETLAALQAGVAERQAVGDELRRARLASGDHAWRAEVAGAERDAHAAHVTQLITERDAARATLQAIYDGGWWRLRDRLRRPRLSR